MMVPTGLLIRIEPLAVSERCLDLAVFVGPSVLLLTIRPEDLHAPTAMERAVRMRQLVAEYGDLARAQRSRA